MTVEVFLSCDFCWHNFISCVTTGISVFMEYTTLLTKFFTWYILSVLTLIPCTSWEKVVLLVRSENTNITVKMCYNTDGSFLSTNMYIRMTKLVLFERGKRRTFHCGQVCAIGQEFSWSSNMMVMPKLSKIQLLKNCCRFHKKTACKKIKKCGKFK